MKTRRLQAGCVALALAGLAAVVSGPASAAPSRLTAEFTARTPAQTAGLPDLDRLDPVRFSLDDAIVEAVRVPSRDGVNTVWVDLVRPATPDGVKVPTILVASPYFNTSGRGYLAQCKEPHQTLPGGVGTPACPAGARTPFPEWYDEYFVPRGYAFAAMDLRGTRNSTGCQQYGDRDEVFDAVDVVDWIADQPWSNGKVGMTGGSYDGTIANGAAAEQPASGKHPDALAAVIPIRAIDRWYDYHFFNGVQSFSHALTPAFFTMVYAGRDMQNSGTDDPLFPAHVVERRACVATVGAAVAAGYSSPYQDSKSPFWAERDFVKDAEGIRAATFVIHGLFDFNVKTNNAGHLWESLPTGLPKKLWLVNGDHFDPRCHDEDACAASDHRVPYPMPDRFVEATHRWWLQFLKGVEAGALATGPVEVQRDDGTWDASAAYPASDRDLVLHFNGDGTAAATAGGEPGAVTWNDAPHNTAPTSQSFVTEPFRTDTRLSGQLQFDLEYAAQGPNTTIAVRIDDVPPDIALDETPTDTLHDEEWEAPLTVTFAWLNALQRDSVEPRGVSWPTLPGSPLQPGRKVTSSFPSLYTDYVVRAGHRLRFTFAAAQGGTTASRVGGEVSLTTVTSQVRLPVAPLGTTVRPTPSRASSPPPTSMPPPPPPAPPAPARPLPSTGAPAAPLGLALACVLAGLVVRRVRRAGTS